MAKVHLIDADDPLIEGADIAAACGRMVNKAAFIFMQDVEAMQNVMDFGTFRNCCRACLEVPLKQRRVYAIMDGQSALHPEEL